MKTQILIIALLIASIFASSFALGETDKLSDIKAKTICSATYSGDISFSFEVSVCQDS